MGASALMPWPFCLMLGVSVGSMSEEEESPAQQDADPYDALLASTFVPMPATGRTEQQTTRQSIQQQPAVSWPSSGGNPINKFNAEGYISCAFPTLFPTGAADFVAHEHGPSLLGTTLSISCCTMMAGLPSTHDSGTLLSTLR